MHTCAFIHIVIKQYAYYKEKEARPTGAPTYSTYVCS